MLPSTVQFFIAMIAYAINERMQKRLEYALEEVRVLKDVVKTSTGTSRISFTADHRRRLALKGKELTPDERRTCCQLVRPETILAWFRHWALGTTTARNASSADHASPGTFGIW